MLPHYELCSLLTIFLCWMKSHFDFVILCCWYNIHSSQLTTKITFYEKKSQLFPYFHVSVKCQENSSIDVTHFNFKSLDRRLLAIPDIYKLSFGMLCERINLKFSSISISSERISCRRTNKCKLDSLSSPS